MVQPHLKAFDDVIAALGGVTATARLVGVAPSNVCRWRAVNRGQFPPAYFFMINELLRERGLPLAPRALFRFAQPRIAANDTSDNHTAA